MRTPNLSELEYLVLDLETTGLYAEQGDEIIEIGALRIQGLEITEEFQSLVKPSKPIPEASSAIHGIRDRDVKNAQSIREVLPEFYSFSGKSTWVAQNARFDLSFLLRDFQFCGLPPIQSLVIDTIGISKMLFPYETSHNLDVMMARLGISKTGSRHRSLDDCRYTAQVLIEFIKLLKKQNLESLKDIQESFVKLDAINKKNKPKARGLFS